jgi:hypothetical protein
VSKQEKLGVHVAHDVRQLRETFAALSSPHPPAIADAIADAFCLRARNLLDFFRIERKRDDDILASDFTAGKYRPVHITALPEDIPTRLIKQLAPLNGRRTTEERKRIGPKERAQIFEALDQEIRAFELQLDEESRAIWRARAVP